MISDSAQAIFDLWVVGDEFTKETFGAFENIKLQTRRDRNLAPTYIQEYYNVLQFDSHKGVKITVARIVNALIEAINSRDRLPKFILFMFDQDIIMNVDVYQQDALMVLHQNVDWVVRQIDMIIRRKRSELLNKKPGAIFTGHPMLIFTHMIRRVHHFAQGSKL